MKKIIFLFTLPFCITISYSQSAKKLVKSGNTKFQKDDYKGAIADYTNAIDIDSNFADAYYYRAYTKFTLKDYQGAIIDYTKNVELDPRSYNGFIDRGDVKYILKNYKGAIDDFSSSLELYSTDYETYFKRGRAKYDTADYRGAIDDFTSAVNLNPFNDFDFKKNRFTDTNNKRQLKIASLYTDALYFRGLSKKNIRNSLEAIIDFTQVVEFNVNVFYSREYDHYLGAFKYASFELPDYLILELNRKSSPNLTNALYYNGLLNYNLHEYKKAIADLSNVIKLNPKYAYAYYYRGVSNYILKDDGIGVKHPSQDFTNFISLDSTVANAYYYRGITSRRSGWRPYDEPYYDFTKAIELDPNFAEAHFERGFEMFRIGSLTNRESFSMDEINANYTRAIELKPNYPEAYYNRGIAKSNIFKKDYTGAIEDYTNAIKLKPSFVDAYYNRGNTYYRIRQNKEACLDIKKTAELGKPYVYDLIKEYCK